MSKVSVIISSYNSEKFIIETLESVYQQTWPEIELIITDDCSNDMTVKICKPWINKNRARFTNAEIICAERNTGVSANANRGLRKATGDWVKFLGADDKLEIDCIFDNMKYIEQNPDVRVLFSRMKIFNRYFDQNNFVRTTPDEEIGRNSILWPERTASSQYSMLLVSDRIHFTPTVFINKYTLLSVGGFDERFRLLEDYPLWLCLTKAGIRLAYMDKTTVKYRIHSEAINNKSLKTILNPNYFRNEKFRKIYTYPNLPNDIFLFQRYNWYVQQIFRLSWFNKETLFNRFLLNSLTIYLNPFKHLIFFRKLINRGLRKNDFYR